MKISKELLDNKFNMIMDNQGRLVLNHQKNPLRHIMNHRDLLGLFRSSHWSCSVKKVFKILQISQKSTCVGAYFRPVTLLKRLQHWCFLVKFSKFLRTSIFKNNCERPLLFVSPQITIANSSGELRLDKTLTGCKLSFIKQNYFNPSNAAISFM